jgi:hypothetical protein
MVMTMLKRRREKRRTRISARSATIPVFKRSIGTGLSMAPTAAGNATSVVTVQLADSCFSQNTPSTVQTEEDVK